MWLLCRGVAAWGGCFSTDMDSSSRSRASLHSMSGRGKGGKGLGKGGAKRHRKVLRDQIQGITKVCQQSCCIVSCVACKSNSMRTKSQASTREFPSNASPQHVHFTSESLRITSRAICHGIFVLRRCAMVFESVPRTCSLPLLYSPPSAAWRVVVV